MRILFFAMLSLSIFSTGCASLNYTGYRQAVKVTSPKPGAEIHHRGELLGVTPAYVLIRRDSKPEIFLNYPGQPVVAKKLDTKFRWWGSFAPNLIGTFYLVPISVGIDHWTGTAWDMDPTIEVIVPGRAPKVAPREKSLAIAPTRAQSLIESDEAGRFLEQTFRLRANWKVAAFDSTLGIFEDQNLRSTSRENLTDPNELYARLKTNFILESAFTYQKPGEVKYEIRDVISGEVVESGLIMAPVAPDTWKSKARDFIIGAVPNTVTLDASAKSLSIEEKSGRTLEAEALPLKGFGDASKFLGAFSFASFLPPNSGSRFSYRLVSGIDLNFRRVQLHEVNLFTIQAYNFKHQRFLAALGGQIYWQGILGVIYLTIMPGYGYSRISWGGANSGSIDRAHGYLIAELGMYRYLSNQLGVRFFTRSVQEDVELWQKAVNRSTVSLSRLETVNTIEIGIGLTYYIPEFGRRWRR